MGYPGPPGPPGPIGPAGPPGLSKITSSAVNELGTSDVRILYIQITAIYSADLNQENHMKIQINIF